MENEEKIKEFEECKMTSSCNNKVDCSDILKTITFMQNPNEIIEFGIHDGLSLKIFADNSHKNCGIKAFDDFNGNCVNKDKLDINLKDNLYAPLNLVTAVDIYNIHLTYLGTGCIYTYDEYHKSGDLTTGFTEDDRPNFKGSAFSTVKGYTDQNMKYKTNVLNLRIRMPISSESNSRNFINKIINYDKICSIPNSMSVLDDLIPIMLDMATKNTIGTYNIPNRLSGQPAGQCFNFMDDTVS